MPRPWVAIGVLTTTVEVRGKLDTPKVEDGKVKFVLDRAREYRLAYEGGRWVVYCR